MNSAEIDCVLRRLLLGKPVKFLGVFAADKVPKRISQYPFCCVINTDPASKPGEHWVACYAESASTLEFFDSFGLPPSTYPHIRGLRNVKFFNNVSLQSMFSRACGPYCVFYISQRSKGISSPCIIARISKLNPLQRDSAVVRHLRSIIRKLIINRPCISDCRGQQCCQPRTRF
jgi:hypothetical protein